MACLVVLGADARTPGTTGDVELEARGTQGKGREGLSTLVNSGAPLSLLSLTGIPGHGEGLGLPTGDIGVVPNTVAWHGKVRI